MNENSEIQKLLHKFILNQCTIEETDKVVEYYRENILTSDFPEVEDIKLLIKEIPEMNESTADKIFSNILIKAKEADIIEIVSEKNPFRKYLAIAASILVVLSIGLSYQHGFFSQKKDDIINNSNEITLQLENGEIQVITANKKSTIADSNGNVVGNQNGNKIVYDTETPLKKLVYNTIKIPYGKRFELQLSDGTMVHLNSGTTLKYPVKFIAGENRQVFLDGEAFFDVTKDKTHPFVVNADKLNIRVLGTHFNVSSYPEDNVTDVVLVEGSVGLYAANEKFNADKNTILKPGFKGSFSKSSSQITTKEVVTDVYTSWIKGGLTFRDMSFKEMSKKLERHYNVTIVNQNNKLSTEKFNASFGDEPIAKVLSYFNEIHGINYTLKNNEVLIK
ncbi:FecR family protein [Flavobacterium cellulosilyticum]|uniref:FecR family protein n=1 Tax=Flavobacterium cellulosilyticum TaxID=2541731 RepID=A0A4R5C1R8_9FLAO|nr:FecR family protein [Flavobacterium cellulosilyticum]TDD93548.1 FecR family protein [Flavobacterium cellulosilyticum]